MKAKKKQSKNLGLGFIFCVLIAVIILISFLFKAYFSIKNSKYDPSVPLLVQVSGAGHSRIFEAISSTLKVLDIKGDTSHINDLSVPVSFKSTGEPNRGDTPSKQVNSIVLSSDKFTIYDKLRFFIFAKTLTKDSITRKEVTLNQSLDENLKSEGDFFNSPDIASDKESIQVINATGETNIASKFARQLEVLGANVILTTTNNSVSPKTKIIYKNKTSPLVLFVEKRFGIKALMGDSSSVADVTIILGKDSLSFF